MKSNVEIMVTDTQANAEAEQRPLLLARVAALPALAVVAFVSLPLLAALAIAALPSAYHPVLGAALVVAACVVVPILLRIQQALRAVLDECDRQRVLLGRTGTAQRILSLRNRELVEARQRLSELDDRDLLTGLANTASLHRQLQLEWRRAARSGQPLALLSLEPDFLADYRDCYGVAAGEALLAALAGLLQGHLRRAGELAAYVGRGEFVLVLPGVTEADARFRADALRDVVARAAIAHRTSAFGNIITLTVGATAGLVDRNVGAAQWLAAARQARTLARDAGRDTSRFVAPSA